MVLQLMLAFQPAVVSGTYLIQNQVNQVYNNIIIHHFMNKSNENEIIFKVKEKHTKKSNKKVDSSPTVINADEQS